MSEMDPEKAKKLIGYVEKVTGQKAENIKRQEKKPRPEVPAEDDGTWLARILATVAPWEIEKEIILGAVKAFGRLNGWKPSRGFFLPGNAGGWVKAYGHSSRWLDHPINYVEGRRPVALVGQPYPGCGLGSLRPILDLGFVLHVPANPLASIWNPGSTLFLVLTQPGVEVKWLPEQADPGWRRGYEGEDRHVAEARAEIAKVTGSETGSVVSFADARRRRRG